MCSTSLLCGRRKFSPTAKFTTRRKFSQSVFVILIQFSYFVRGFHVRNYFEKVVTRILHHCSVRMQAAMFLNLGLEL